MMCYKNHTNNFGSFLRKMRSGSIFGPPGRLKKRRTASINVVMLLNFSVDVSFIACKNIFASRLSKCYMLHINGNLMCCCSIGRPANPRTTAWWWAILCVESEKIFCQRFVISYVAIVWFLTRTLPFKNQPVTQPILIKTDTSISKCLSVTT